MSPFGRSDLVPIPGAVGDGSAVSARTLPRCGPLASLFALLFLSLTACTDESEIVPPTPLYGNLPIEYPLDLWDADVEGETLLRVRVSERGDVDSVEVLEPSGYPAFDSAAVRGARLLRYSPATREDRRISVWAKVPVQFSKGGS